MPRLYITATVKKRINVVDKETGEIRTKAVGNARGWSTSKSKNIDSTTDRNRRGSRTLDYQSKHNETSTWYVNKHYKFIDRILADIMPKIASTTWWNITSWNINR